MPPASTATAPATAANAPYSLAIDPAGYLYVGSNDTPNGFIEGFSITNGVLATLSGSPYSSAVPTSLNEPFGLAIDSTDSYVYAANVFAPAVNSYSITTGTGVLERTYAGIA